MFFTKIFVRRLSSGLLSDVKVLDMTRVLAGPFCTMLLSDLGAQVIKIEKPNVGDETRNWGPPFIKGQLSCYFASVNRNKKSVAINLKDPKGIELIIDLAKKCDVFVENYVPGKLSKMGLGYEHIKKVNPSIVYCSVTGFGSTGPYAKRAGYDVIAASIGGLLSITGPENGEPCKAGVAITDLTTGLYAKSGILAGLLQKKMKGIGCKVDCNLLSSQVSMLANAASGYINCGEKPIRRGTAHENIVPYQSFQCKDSQWITVGAGSNKMFAVLCDRIGLSELKNDKRFENNAKRVENRKLVISLISEKMKTRSVKEWLNILEGCGFPYGPVNELDEVFKDEQVLHSELVIDADHPKVGKVKMVFTPVKYQSEDNMLNFNVSAPPSLGQHTEQVLKDVLNLDPSTINSLREQNIIQCHKE